MAPIYPREVILQGKDKVLVDPEIRLYEKTTDDIEDVVGRVSMLGSDNNHVMLSDGSAPNGWFLKQWKHLPLVNEKYSSNHAQDGKCVDHVAGGKFLLKAALATTQTITKGMELESIAAGLVQAKTTGIVVAVAAEDMATTTEVGYIKAWSLINA